MAILIDIATPEWKTDEDAKSDLLRLDPNLDVRTYDSMGDSTEIQTLATVKLRTDLLDLLPNLKLIQKLGAGVDTMLANPSLPDHVRIARLRFEQPAREMAEYCLSYVLREQRNHAVHSDNQQQRRWQLLEPKNSAETTIGVLGLGQVGHTVAQLMNTVGFKTMGWSRTQKKLDGIKCVSGPSGLTTLLSDSDYVIAVLPSTPRTRKLMNLSTFSQMKKGATFINIGRGDLVEEADLISSLDADQLNHAVLDVMSTEPLPATSQLWLHPKVTITPHNSAWSLGDGLKIVAENHKRLFEGLPLRNEINRDIGY